MPLLPDLTHRSNEPELMDAPDGDKEQLFKTLEQFRWINRLLTPCRRLLSGYFISRMRTEPKRRWSFLDVGAGGADLAIWFTRRCDQLGLDVDVTCLDYDLRATEFAQLKAARFLNIRIVHTDALQLAETGQCWDFVFTNHFLHHLPDDQIVSMLATFARICRHRFVLSDLQRSRFNYLVFSAIAAVALRNSFSYDDGRLSIRKGFTVQECWSLVETAGLSHRAHVRACFPGHVAIVGRPNS